MPCLVSTLHTAVGYGSKDFLVCCINVSCELPKKKNNQLLCVTSRARTDAILFWFSVKQGGDKNRTSKSSFYYVVI